MEATVYLALFVTATAAIVFQRLWTEWQQRRLAHQSGCQPPRKYRHYLPFGLDLYRARMKAVRVGRYNQFNKSLFDHYGSTYQEYSLGGWVINTTETENFQTVGATKFQDYGKDWKRTKNSEPFFGRGLLTDSGPSWKHTRSLVNPLFKRAELSKDALASYQKFIDRMFTLIPRDGSTVDLQPLLQKLFLDSSSEFIFGESIDSLRDTSGEAQMFLNAFNEALAGAGKRGNYAGGPIALLFMFDKSWKRQCAYVHDWIDKRIDKFLALSGSNAKTEKDGIRAESQGYVLLEGMAKDISDPVELRFQLLNIFFPARDTTAVAVSNTLFHLARNPQIWRELRRQALAINQPLTFELLKSLHSFRYALFEGIRLQGPSGHVQRVALRDTILPCGGGPNGSFPVFVSEGTEVVLNNYPKMRDPAIWGPDVEAFRPDRFEGKLLTWEFTPFFGGPRICPASQQVIVQGVYLLVRMVTEFESIENRDDCLEYIEQIRMVCESKNGVKVALHPAKITKEDAFE